MTTSAVFWRCPRCRGALVPTGSQLACAGCGTLYPVVAGIADLRVQGPCAIDFAADSEAAARLASQAGRLTVDAVMRCALSSRAPEEWSDARLDLRTAQSLQASERLRAELRGWLRPCASGHGPVLDAGCGFGGLLVAAAEEGVSTVGVDASLVNLVVARRVLEERGYRAEVAAALVERLPMADESVSAVVALDIIEHVADPAGFARELARVCRRGAFVALSTPNRFSLAAEPHVSAWGVGWLPRRWQAGYVHWRTGLGYAYVRLLSAREIRRLLTGHAGIRCAVEAAPVPADEAARFRARRRRLAAFYNRLVKLPILRPALRLFGPFFHVVGWKA